MNIKRRIIGKIVFPIFVIYLLIAFVACSDSNAPIVSNEPPNTFADVSGRYELDYRGLAKLFIITEPNGLTISTKHQDSTGRKIYLGMNVYFPKGKTPLGTFPIVSKKDTHTIYAIAFFQVNNQLFISHSGEMSITKLINDKLKATFHFLAKDTSGNSVMIKNGNINIIE